MTDLIDLIFHVYHLKQLPRTGWLFAGISNPESIADHSFATAVLTLILGNRVNDAWQDENLSAPLDVGYAVQMALLHDMAESVLTDLPHRSTKMLGRESKRRAESRIIDTLFAGITGAAYYENLCQEYSEVSSPEARLVKDTDKLEMVFQAHRYEEQRGQVNLAEFWRGHIWHYDASRSLFDQISAQRTRLKL